jgi:hypothetical protein
MSPDLILAVSVFVTVAAVAIAEIGDQPDG